MGGDKHLRRDTGIDEGVEQCSSRRRMQTSLRLLDSDERHVRFAAHSILEHGNKHGQGSQRAVGNLVWHECPLLTIHLAGVMEGEQIVPAQVLNADPL